MTSVVSQIEYEKRNTPRVGESAFRTAVFCGAFPLILGVSLLIAYATTERLFLAVAGFALLFVGIIFFFVGLVALGKYYRAQIRAFGSLEKRAALKFWLTLLLLV